MWIRLGNRLINTDKYSKFEKWIKTYTVGDPQFTIEIDNDTSIYYDNEKERDEEFDRLVEILCGRYPWTLDK